MNIKELSKEVGVSEQITLEDIQTIRDAGYQSIVCHRPNEEAGDQAHFQEIAAHAKKLGLVTSYQPVVSGKITDEDVVAFKGILAKFPTPILAYCRTGTRSTILWSLAKSDEVSISEILAVTQAAGYDMTSVVQRIANGSSEAAK